MQGFITGKHVVRYGVSIIRSFGIVCWLRCVAALLSAEPTTFLAVVFSVSTRAKE
jgi:hypothetical protein